LIDWQIENEYYDEKHKKEEKASYGTPADREARVRDSLMTEVAKCFD
jgi:hypothetical protein